MDGQVQLVLQSLEGEYAVCRLDSLPDMRGLAGIFFLGRTREEISLVCETGQVPKCASKAERGWRCFQVEGTLAFSLVGILSAISGVLAGNGVSLFAVSTYDTDYFLVRTETFQRACLALRAAGYEVRE